MRFAGKLVSSVAANTLLLPASLSTRYICLLPSQLPQVEEDGYEAYLHDAESAFHYGRHIARLVQPLLPPAEPGSEAAPETFLPTLLRHLKRFTSADKERNLMLTGMITCLATYPDSRIFHHVFNSDLMIEEGALAAIGLSVLRASAHLWLS